MSLCEGSLLSNRFCPISNFSFHKSILFSNNLHLFINFLPNSWYTKEE